MLSLLILDAISLLEFIFSIPINILSELNKSIITYILNSSLTSSSPKIAILSMVILLD